MDPALVDSLLGDLIDAADLRGEVVREPLRGWEMSAVERLHLADETTLFFKCATAPMCGEAAVLGHVAAHGVPAPAVVAAIERSDHAGMLLEDLGPPTREPTLADAAVAAVAAHVTPPLDGSPLLDETALAALPRHCLRSLHRLSDRWRDVGDILERLACIDSCAEERAKGAEIAPFGMCHSEFNATSVHITANGWHLVDWARAFEGPGLLDLASWQPTREAPDLDAFDTLTAAYVAAGGRPAARSERGGLPAARWAYGWHRLWVIDWYLQQATTWIADPAMDARYQATVRRHLGEAVECLTAR